MTRRIPSTSPLRWRCRTAERPSRDNAASMSSFLSGATSLRLRSEGSVERAWRAGILMWDAAGTRLRTSRWDKRPIERRCCATSSVHSDAGGANCLYEDKGSSSRVEIAVTMFWTNSPFVRMGCPRSSTNSKLSRRSVGERHSTNDAVSLYFM